MRKLLSINNLHSYECKVYNILDKNKYLRRIALTRNNNIAYHNPIAENYYAVFDIYDKIIHNTENKYKYALKDFIPFVGLLLAK